MSFNNLLSCATITTIQFKNILVTPVRSLMLFNLYPHPHCWATTTDLLSISIDLPIPDISHKWNHVVVGLLCLVSITQHKTLRFAHVVVYILFHSFLLLNIIPLDDYTFYLSFHQLIDIELFLLWGYYEQCYHEYLRASLCVDICFRSS